jgi:hypothetical protein
MYAQFQPASRRDETVYRAGALAYLDAGPGAGLVPVKVVSIETAGSGNYATAGSVTVKVTASRGRYKRGEVISGERAWAVVPRPCAFIRGRFFKVSTLYRWE